MIKYILIIFLLSFFSEASAGVIAGKLESTALGSLNEEDEISVSFWNSARLEFILPRGDRVSSRFELDVFESGGVSDIFIRSLYLRRRADNYHLTLGIQPVSWSFGSMINPADYTPGAEVGDTERRGKFISGAELYIPTGWNSGISLVASAIENSSRIKSGLRMRGGIRGFDLSAGIINEPENEGNSTRNRAVFSIKGDIGPLGIYTAGGAIWMRDEYPDADSALMLGGDMSFNVFDIYRLMVQGEFMSAPSGYINELTGASLDTEEKREELAAASVSFAVDDFTTIGLSGFYFLNADSLILSPYLNTELGGNLLLNIRGGYMSGTNIALFGQTLFEGELSPVEGLLQVTLSYAF